MALSTTDRLVVRFNPDTLTFYANGQRRRKPLDATLTHYVSRPSRTPSGGRYTSQRFTVVIDGRKWWGTVKSGTDVVRLHPATH